MSEQTKGVRKTRSLRSTTSSGVKRRSGGQASKAGASVQGDQPDNSIANIELVSKPADPLVPAHYPELVFGFVGPAGANLVPVIGTLDRLLRALSYRVCTIRLSKVLEDFLGRDYSKEPEDTRLEKLMSDGTNVRERCGRGDAIALLGITEIRKKRAQMFGNQYEKNAYLLRSLKHPEEVQTLRNVYGKGFFLVSAYCPRDQRVDDLATRIAKSKNGNARGSRAAAETLIERDESEEGTELGQDVKDAFPLADLFVDCREKSSYEKKLSRFVELLFGHPFHTPTRDEHGMYHARSAALRSADLGRQVGAAILSKDGDVLAVGCNEVPKAGGGLYWTGDVPDGRDFLRGRDSTAEQREQLIAELIKRLDEVGLINSGVVGPTINHVIEELTKGSKRSLLRGSRVASLLEFGRSVHAEMAALMASARLGVSVRGSTMFTTTFPCHICARHIVAAGIERVVYIEPYPKSMARELYSDSVRVDPPSIDGNFVNFEPFVGVAPRQYLEIFDPGDKRKDVSGYPTNWQVSDKRPRLQRFRNTYREIETVIVATAIPKLAQAVGVQLRLDELND